MHDQCNLIGEFDGTMQPVRTYTWGLDLSATEQGAGGIGGLLAIHEVGTGQTHLPFYDGNGNVLGLVNLASGNVSADYAYGPFGELIRATVPAAKANPFSFSTKYQDPETHLLYYGQRYYSTALGRWLSKDPIEENGGVILYGFANNNPVNQYDILGLTLPGPGNLLKLFGDFQLDVDIINHWFWTAPLPFRANSGRFFGEGGFPIGQLYFYMPEMLIAAKPYLDEVCKCKEVKVTNFKIRGKNTGYSMIGRANFIINGDLVPKVYGNSVKWEFKGKVKIDRDTFDFWPLWDRRRETHSNIANVIGQLWQISMLPRGLPFNIYFEPETQMDHYGTCN